MPMLTEFLTTRRIRALDTMIMLRHCCGGGSIENVENYAFPEPKLDRTTMLKAQLLQIGAMWDDGFMTTCSDLLG